jgi:hypothetical protein
MERFKASLRGQYVLSWLIALWCGSWAVAVPVAYLGDPDYRDDELITWSLVVFVMGIVGVLATAYTEAAARGSGRMRAGVLSGLGLYALGTVFTLPSGLIGLVNTVLAALGAVRYMRALRKAREERAGPPNVDRP